MSKKSAKKKKGALKPKPKKILAIVPDPNEPTKAIVTFEAEAEDVPAEIFAVPTPIALDSPDLPPVVKKWYEGWFDWFD